jgi:predicted dehydrogenase
MSLLESFDRRDFLKSVAAAAGVSFLGMTAAQAQDAEAAPLRVALIGCGSQGRVVLLPNAMKTPGIKMVAACDIVEKNRDAAAKMMGEGTPTFESYEDLLAQVELDAVIVATPLHWHAPITIAALGKGLHVFCEKCMARTVDECKDMIRAQQAAGKTLQIGHHLRYHPLYWYAKRTYIGDGKKGLVGQVTSIYAQWSRNGSWRRPAAPEGDYSKWGYASPDDLANWRLNSAFSGGIMTELASHQLDAASWMIGKTPIAVQGVGGIDYYQDGRTVFDNVHVCFEYPDGIKLDYICGTTNAFSVFGSEAHEMYRGKDGTLILAHLNPDPKHSMGWFFLEADAQKTEWMEAAHTADINGREAICLDATVSADREFIGQPISSLIDAEGVLSKMTYQLEFEEFVVSCRESRVPTCDGNVGMRSAAEALLAVEAMQTKTRIELSEDLYTV